MNREVLYRAKRIKTGEWIEGSLLQTTAVSLKSFIVPSACYTFDKWDWAEWLHVDTDTICQWTGLLDRNGNKIWENDILFDDDVCSLVRWDNETARFVIDDYGTKGCIMEYGYDEDAGEYGIIDTNGFDDFCDDAHMIFKVIGNLFDNPELLKRK